VHIHSSLVHCPAFYITLLCCRISFPTMRILVYIILFRSLLCLFLSSSHLYPSSCFYSFVTINDLYTQRNHVPLFTPLFQRMFHFIMNVSASDKCLSDHNSIHIQPLTHSLLLFFLTPNIFVIPLFARYSHADTHLISVSS